MSISEVLLFVAPGLCGSVVALFYDEELTLKRSVLIVLVGLSFSVYIAPAVIEHFTLSDKFALATNFLLARYADTLMKVLTGQLPKLAKTYLNRLTTKTDSTDGTE